MARTIAIYLAGKIQKAHEEPNETYWTEADQAIIRASMSPHNVQFLNPATRTDDLSDQKSVFGRDMVQVSTADAIFVDARDRRGLGVGAEMMWAKMRRTPVVTLAPLGSHYHKEKTSLLGINVEGWVHPFVEALSDGIVGCLEDAGAWMLRYLNGEAATIRGPNTIQEAMEYYLETQYARDLPMKELSETSAALRSRFDALKSRESFLSLN